MPQSGLVSPIRDLPVQYRVTAFSAFRDTYDPGRLSHFSRAERYTATASPGTPVRR